MTAASKEALALARDPFASRLRSSVVEEP